MTHARTLTAAALAAMALAGCPPAVIRDPPVSPPPAGCEAGATSCHGGAPWRCGPGGAWSQADRACGRLRATDGGAAVCCATPSPVRPGAAVHACVPAALCADGGAP